MKKLKIIFFYLIVSLSLGVLLQCNTLSTCDCPENIKPFVSIDGIGVLHRDNSGQLIKEQSKVFVNQYFWVTPMLTSFTTQNQNYNSYLFNPFINEAIACECPFDGSSGLKSKIDTVLFTLMSDYDSGFKKGDCLNSIIEIEDRGLFPTTIITYKNYIQELNLNSFFLGERFAFRVKHTSEFLEKLNKQVNGVPFQVAVEIKFKDGTSEKGYSEEIYLMQQ